MRSTRSSSAAAPPRSRHRSATATGESAADVETQQLISQLEQISLELTVSVHHDDDVRYVLVVRHARARAMWKHPRSFDEYHSFEDRLLQALHHGHACRGECPWLETFLTSYFPAKTRFLLGSTSRMIVDRRRDALLLVLQTIRSFLLKRENLSCLVAKAHVAREYLGFVYGELLDEQRVLGHALHLPSAAEVDPRAVALEHVRSSLGGSGAGHTHGSSDSASGSDDETGAQRLSRTTRSPTAAPDICALCDLPMPVKNIYVMQLRCGHRFHDECVLPKLNDDLRCPTCGVRDA